MHCHIKTIIIKKMNHSSFSLRRTLICFGAVAFLFSLPLAAQQKEARDHSTKPDSYFLYEGQQPNSLYYLPTPPQAGSIRWLCDKEMYDWGKSKRDSARGEQAQSDANSSADGVAYAFSDAFGIEIGKETTPAIYALVAGMREDAGDLATREAKNHYSRKRPFSFFAEETCLPEHQKELSTNGSYPSGHTSIAWATALVLVEINPERQNEILARGFEMGQSRVICGYHYQSDVDAGRLTGSAIVARLHADDNFMKALDAAKKEFARLKKEDKVKPSEIINCEKSVITE